MLVESKIDKSQWIWINIPKTASTLIRNSIFKYEDENDRQDHFTFIENVQLHGIGSRDRGAESKEGV